MAKTELSPFFRFLAALALAVLLAASPAEAASVEEAPRIPIPLLQLGVVPADSPEDVAVSLQIMALLTVLTLAPAILLMLTSFTRIVVVLGFIQRAIGLQQSPPQQTIVSLALFLALFTMYPTWNRVYENGLAPYLAREIDSSRAWAETVTPLREFMFRYTRQEELSLMVSMANLERPETPEEIPTRVLIPAFMLSELKTAFQMGVVIYIPFIIVDMIVSSVLLAIGMMMLPPMMISLPFKILLFVMADGWNLVVVSLLKSFTNVPLGGWVLDIVPISMFDILNEAVWTMLLVTLPILLVAMGVGLVIGILQTATSIQEQTLIFIPKILAVFLFIVFVGPWMAGRILSITQEILGHLERFIQ